MPNDTELLRELAEKSYDFHSLVCHYPPGSWTKIKDAWAIMKRTWDEIVKGREGKRA